MECKEKGHLMLQMRMHARIHTEKGVRKKQTKIESDYNGKK